MSGVAFFACALLLLVRWFGLRYAALKYEAVFSINVCKRQLPFNILRKIPIETAVRLYSGSFHHGQISSATPLNIHNTVITAVPRCDTAVLFVLQ